ncbi:2-oxo acid dehydrogenase subunit E2, partial [Parafrankia sp. Ea1.12]|uniref:2-oxo acid dehydrogenase subunit E2 n=1 Tax=Parafrankia sp. Ea1.12 TaxID=573499 RepID=UPI001F2D1DEB
MDAVGAAAGAGRAAAGAVGACAGAGAAGKIDELAARTRANQVSPDDLGGGTFTLTNTGSRGA